MNRSMKWLTVSEVVVCFALPAYFLFWGVVTLPLWLMGRPAAYAIIHALCTIGGILGMLALVRVLRYVLSSQERSPNWYVVGSLAGLGVLSLWTEITGQFIWPYLNLVTALVVMAPTLCTAHLVWLGLRKARRGGSNKPMHATCENARA